MPADRSDAACTVAGVRKLSLAADIRSFDTTIALRGPYWREQRNAQNLRSRFSSLSGLGTVTGRASLV